MIYPATLKVSENPVYPEKGFCVPRILANVLDPL